MKAFMISDFGFLISGPTPETKLAASIHSAAPRRRFSTPANPISAIRNPKS